MLLWKDNGYNGGALEICKNANAATLGAFNNWASSAQYDESPAVAGVFGVCVYVGQNFVGEMWKAFTHLDQVQLGAQLRQRQRRIGPLGQRHELRRRLGRRRVDPRADLATPWRGSARSCTLMGS